MRWGRRTPTRTARSGRATHGRSRRAEQDEQARYLERTGRPLLLDYAQQERGGPRVVADCPGWLVVVPFWAAWPFETLVIPTSRAARLADLDDAARDGLAQALRDLTSRYDAL